MSNTYVIGDVHGRYDLLITSLNAIENHSKRKKS